MKSANRNEIQQAFTQQAAEFESRKMNFTKQEYMDYTIRKIAPTKVDSILEVAAGTCICGRSIAPYAKQVTCLDMTPAMLMVGKKAAEKENAENMTFVLGDAVELPFLDESFEIVFSRLAFHHFTNMEQPFSEMKRVLKPGGKLVVIDMEAAEETLRQVEDEIETLRDPSHVRNRSKAEFLSLYQANGLSVEICEITKIPVVLQNWMELTQTPDSTQNSIISRMEEEMNGKTKTGFFPYRQNGKIMFDQRWMLMIGKK